MSHVSFWTCLWLISVYFVRVQFGLVFSFPVFNVECGNVITGLRASISCTQFYVAIHVKKEILTVNDVRFIILLMCVLAY